MKNTKKKLLTATVAAGLLAINVLANPLASFAKSSDDSSITKTPIKHVVVIFGENVSFDHYFGTYPYAKNLPGEPQFPAKPNTPTINGLMPNALNGNLDLLNHNPNSAQPKRLAPSQAMTADMDHAYHDEITATNGGKMDKFVESTGAGADKTLVMNYYDGNTVTALWNYAQNFAMSDNSFNTTYGPSTPGALNLISGETQGATLYDGNGNPYPATTNKPNTYENRTVTGDPRPFLDKVSTGDRVKMDDTNKNVGDLLNAKGITWGWFQGGFADPSATTKNIAGAAPKDYIQHHEPFQYYASTANKDHLPPSSVDIIGKQDQANHQYDIKDFWKAVDNGNMPSVSYLKAPAAQDGHAGYSDPLDEQKFIADTINHLENTPDWKDTAVVLAYDDSDGWYDHVYSPSNGQAEASGKAGLGPRLPLLVVSPYAKTNFVDHTLTDQSSILKFIEDNWNLGHIGGGSSDVKAGSIENMFDFSKPKAEKLFLDTNTGQKVDSNNASQFESLSSFLVSKDGGKFGPVSDGQGTATLSVPAGAFSSDTLVNISGNYANKLGNIIPGDKTVAAAFGVNFSKDKTPAQPVTFTISNPAIHANSEVYKIQGGNLVKVNATVSEGKVDISFDTDPDFVVLNPKASAGTATLTATTSQTPSVPQTTGDVVSGGTSPKTGVHFIDTLLGAFALVTAGFALVRTSLRKSKILR